MTRLFRLGLSGAGPFVCRCLTSLAMPRFHSPLIKLDVRISRIQLSDKAASHAIRTRSHTNRCGLFPVSWCKPSVRCR